MQTQQTAPTATQTTTGTTSPTARAVAEAEAGSEPLKLTRSRLRDDIARSLAELISANEMDPAQRLKESALAKRLGVSRTPLREALLILEREGLVTSEVNKGFRVVRVSEQRVREIYPMLGALEALAVRDGIAVLQPCAGELQTINARRRAARTNPKRHGLDRAFHEALCAGTTNATLVESIRRLWLQAQQFDGAGERGMANLDGSLREHAAIAQAIHRGNGDEAGKLVEAHWRGGIDVVIHWLRGTGAALALVLAVGVAALATLATSRVADAQPANGQSANAQPANAQPASARPANARSAHAQLADAQPATAQPANAQPVHADPGPKPAMAQATIKSSPCPVPAATGESIECFTLTVPENRARPVQSPARTIAIPIVRFKSRAAHPGEPLVFLAGGPGTSAIRQRLSGAHNPYLDDRDFILFQQRGVKFAAPDLECPEYDHTATAPFEIRVAQQVAAAKHCAQRLAADGVDLDAYDTSAIVADLLDMQRALHLPAIDLYGVSYGTRVALEALRAAPDGIHAVVLDSVLPPDVRYDELATDNALAALDRVLDRCAVDPDCARAFPDLRARWTAQLASAQQRPLVAPGNAKLHTHDLVEAVYDALDSRSLLPAIPALVDAIARGDASVAAKILADNAGPSGAARGQRLSVWCRDEAPITNPARASRHPELDGWQTVAFAPEVCAAWPVAPSTGPRTPVVSQVPTLVLAGEFDPNTPPEWGRRALATLANGVFVELPDETHVAGDGPCAVAIARAFLRDPQRLPDVTCAAKTARAPFVARL